ncbi:MAG: DNA repair protein RecO [Acidobacteriota bacterium]|nr:DNA repair protein RecO [Acidobacteriota bacterium]
MRSYPLSEADKIVACLTPDYGLIRLVAKGARKIKSRFSGSIEPFSVGEIAFYRREDAELGILRSIELKQSYFHLAKNVNMVAALAYFGELLADFSPPHEPNENLYRMARACFKAVAGVSDDQNKMGAGVLYFELWILRLTGYLPASNVCGECRSPIRPDESVVWSSENRFLCELCAPVGRGIILKPQQAVLLSLARKLAPEAFIAQSVYKREFLKPHSAITRKLIKQVLLRDLEYWSEKNWEAVEL